MAEDDRLSSSVNMPDLSCPHHRTAGNEMVLSAQAYSALKLKMHSTIDDILNFMHRQRPLSMHAGTNIPKFRKEVASYGPEAARPAFYC
jgi:hypothetical protein